MLTFQRLHRTAETRMHHGITAGPPVSLVNFRQRASRTCEDCEDRTRLNRFRSYRPVNDRRRSVRPYCLVERFRAGRSPRPL
ncbi:hypothetical protein EUA04_05465 [Mycolicibacterium obuense]|uniref:Uncharacterized protein n=1 Tax=Mycolicibacterium obuense TaxID=1807 RepID=A0A4V3AZD6_9MYCO|nr:hypothetical protein EUA04_05465 [Mycolicibacterium obuense]